MIGALPGEVEEVPAPSKPPWMDRANLGYQVFELAPRFDVVWVITYWNLAPTVRVRLKQLLPPAPLDPEASADGVAEWCRALAGAPAPGDLEAAELWSSYQARAAEAAAT